MSKKLVSSLAASVAQMFVFQGADKIDCGTHDNRCRELAIAALILMTHETSPLRRSVAAALIDLIASTAAIWPYDGLLIDKAQVGRVRGLCEDFKSILSECVGDDGASGPFPPRIEWPEDFEDIVLMMKRLAGVSTDCGLSQFMGKSQSWLATNRRRGSVPQKALLEFERRIGGGFSHA
ncbi:hypothetical protein ACFQ1E_08130 [Sphingomonas canadensis]|uniref:Uncharacterized protein n=1 Tax=Sphingomonas canadensis TaxID=1219257 RepID=A0ABW3H6J8_9SPHN|nr:hypothetical protein [Sphingomonas canadensis]MCW3836004.1 hypothetical protein [Sphingomonas canadensis]